jgi:protein-tyrosine phosphatase
MRVLAVCLGNICRSPAAEAAIREAAAAAGVVVEVDSAGTGSWHIGEPPNPRMVAAAAAKGLRIAGIARQVTEEDFHRHDLIVAMDRQNLTDLERMRPARSLAEVRLFRSFDPAADDPEVPDPYHGPDEGFDTVVDMVRSAAAGLAADLTP